MNEDQEGLSRRRTPVLTAPVALGTVTVGVILLAVLVGIAWRSTSAVWFLLFPLLLMGVLSALAVGVLWGLRHF
jgi:lysylphosphatidylglycerol synthetase-like protein (DUF2156 family)